MIKISYHQRKVLPKNFWKTFWPNSFFGFHFLLHLIILLLELWLNNHCQYDTPACQNKLVKISLILQAYKLTLWIRKNLTIAKTSFCGSFINQNEENWTFPIRGQTYLSFKTIPGSIGSFFDVLLHVKGWPLLKFWCM